MRLTRITMAGIAAGVLLVVAACGGSDASQAPDSASPSDSATPSEPEDTGSSDDTTGEPQESSGKGRALKPADLPRGSN